MSAAAQQRVVAARRLEESDDVLLRVLASLSLEERLRLTPVSKRWQRLLMTELRFPAWHVWRAPAVVRRVGNALRVLHVCATEVRTLDEVHRVLISGGGAELRTLVTWDDGEDRTRAEPFANIAFFTSDEALQLRAACPRLGAATRLAVHAAGAAQAASLLNVLPGRHYLVLDELAEAWTSAATAADAGAALRALVCHPRLCGLDVNGGDNATLFDSVAGAVVGGLTAARDQREGCSLEHLRLSGGDPNRQPDGLHTAFPDAAAVEATFGVAGAPGQEQAVCSLRSFAVIGAVPAAHTRGVLAASLGSLERLYVEDGTSLVGQDAATELGEAFVRRATSLETFALNNVSDAGVLPQLLAPLLAARSCRLRFLKLAGADFRTLPVRPPEESLRTAVAFFDALSRNRSLRHLELENLSWWPLDSALFASALAARSAPLDSVLVGPCPFTDENEEEGPLCARAQTEG